MKSCHPERRRSRLHRERRSRRTCGFIGAPDIFLLFSNAPGLLSVPRCRYGEAADTTQSTILSNALPHSPPLPRNRLCRSRPSRPPHFPSSPSRCHRTHPRPSRRQSLSTRITSDHHRHPGPTQHRRSARLLLRRGLLVARPQKPHWPLHPPRRLLQPRQLRRPPPGDATPLRADARPHRGVAHHERS